MAAPATPAASYKMISIPEAQDTVLAHATALPAETVGLSEALGCVLAEDVLAADDLPPFPASIKDGYAVAAADGAGEFRVAFEVLAGASPPVLPARQVAYISTGAPLPPNADAVVQIEDTERLAHGPDGRPRVRINKAARGRGQDVRAVGSDIRAGEEVLRAGALLGAAEVGLLATVGAARVRVHRRPRVAVLSTGDEVVDAADGGMPPGPGQIRDANRPMLLAAARDAGAGAALDLGIARDTAQEVEAHFERALQEGADVLLTSGGVSMGDKDFIKPLLERRGTVHFGKVRMKPGKPLTFATINVPGSGGALPRRLLAFGLPGNPVSSLVTFHLVVLPALRALSGWQEPRLRRVDVRTTADIRLDPERPEYHRVTLSWARTESGAELCAASTGGQISSRLLSMRSANALLELPSARGTLPAGSMVSALLIADLREMPAADLPAITDLQLA